MADTRKDRRAPVSLKVRFKSATVDEFIEQYAVDISRGGIFIKSKSPMAVGTLLKFEFQLKDESRLIHGVGRVVWRREPGDASDDSPPGMGIKFIKMDPQSRSLVEKIASARGPEEGQFERGTGSVQKLPPRKKTEPFFPAASGPADLPAPEDRTQVRHASEFLASALSGADEDAAAEAAAKAEEARRRTEEIQRKRAEAAAAQKKAQEARERAEKEARERAKAQAAEASSRLAAASEVEPEEKGESDAETVAAPLAALEAQANADIDSLLEDELTMAAPSVSESLAAQHGSGDDEDDDEDDVETRVAPVGKLLEQAAAEAEAEAEAEEAAQAFQQAPSVEPVEPRHPTPTPTPTPSPSPSVGQASEPPAPKSKSIAIPAAIAAVAIAVIGYFVYTNVIAAPSPDEPTQVANAPDPATEPEEPTDPDPLVEETEPEPEQIPEGPTTSVRVESSPAGAQVTVNGAARGTTPLDVDLPIGEEVTVAVRLEGYVVDSQDVVAEEGMGPHRVRLTEMDYVIAVETTPPGARVTANGQRTNAPGELAVGRPTAPIDVTATLSGFERTSATVAPDSFVEDGGRMLRVLSITLPERERPTPSANDRPTMRDTSTMMTGMVTEMGGDTEEPTMEATMATPMETPPDPPPPDPPPTMDGVPDNPF